MNLEMLKGMLLVGERIVPILEGLLAEVGPAVATLGPDVAQLVTDANKTLVDLKTIFEALKTNVVTAAVPPSAPPAPPVA